MRRTKRLAAGLLCAAMTALLIVPSAAHCCRGGRGAGRHSGTRQSVQATVTVCPLEDCTLAGRHTHDGVAYCGYDHESGVCTGGCRALCPFEDCALAGRHTHDGVAYCGASHDCGYCDGSCSAGAGCGRHVGC